MSYRPVTNPFGIENRRARNLPMAVATGLGGAFKAITSTGMALLGGLSSSDRLDARKRAHGVLNVLLAAEPEDTGPILHTFTVTEDGRHALGSLAAICMVPNKGPKFALVRDYVMANAQAWFAPSPAQAP